MQPITLPNQTLGTTLSLTLMQADVLLLASNRRTSGLWNKYLVSIISNATIAAQTNIF